ncbi:diguanylate cyclase (GGDEF) domain-containing protein [Oceanospirillum multiglobuliferum]|uniref:GGDEF domain-containing protein n=1 Tax=Oceanospirillum multiglobuliferum TaxID=64969 RepID=A0A1T4P162_9GAMM|nr:GGDEF domain-containing protein [Oceanospirillum multiglobuliferum]OPX55090.1 hypothetical protein BTE48_10690 [Oceanospirillum multiglobuliferum]SJZ85047.1 diguanylate cyclase (GGDEF) domain-containing protein [Oceanospirillum multiglobuliferum]
MLAQINEQGQHKLSSPKTEETTAVVLEITMDQQLKNIDSLTGLQCRSNFEMQKLSATFNQQVQAAILIDFDHFSQVNETYGRVTGDFVLSLQAERLQHDYAHLGMIYRYEGDRFLLIVTSDSDTTEQLILLGENIQQTMNKPVKLSQTEVITTCCIGLAVKDKKMSLGLLITEVMIATEEAKSKAKNSIQLHRGFQASKLINEIH